MIKKVMLSAFAIGMTLCLTLVTMDASAQQRGKSPIRVLGPDKEEVTRPACDINRGRGLGSQLDCTQFVDGTVRLHGIISGIDGDLFAILDGAFVIDSSSAEIGCTPQFKQNGIGDEVQCATDGECPGNGRGLKKHRPAPANPIIECPTDVALEVGQVVSVFGQFVEDEDGIVLVATDVRIMKMEPLCLDTNEGGICGIIDSLDIEQGVIVIAGISILIDENTVVRTKDGLEAVQAGDFANVRIKALDVDEDGAIDTLVADYLVSFPLTVEP